MNEKPDNGRQSMDSNKGGLRTTGDENSSQITSRLSESESIETENFECLTVSGQTSEIHPIDDTNDSDLDLEDMSNDETSNDSIDHILNCYSRKLSKKKKPKICLPIQNKDLKDFKKQYHCFFSNNRDNDHRFDPFRNRLVVSTKNEPKNMKPIQTLEHRFEFLIFNKQYNRRIRQLVNETVPDNTLFIMYSIPEQVLKVFEFYSIIASKQQYITEILEEIQKKGIQLKVLSPIHCSICYSSYHLKPECNSCRVCLSEDYQTKHCQKMLDHLEETKQLSIAPIIRKTQTISDKTLLMREYRNKMGFFLKTTHKVPYYCWNTSGHEYAQQYWQFASLDTEKGRIADNSTKAIRVVVNNNPYGLENCAVLICCYIKDPEVIDTAIQHSSTTPTGIETIVQRIDRFRNDFYRLMSMCFVDSVRSTLMFVLFLF